MPPYYKYCPIHFGCHYFKNAEVHFLCVLATFADSLLHQVHTKNSMNSVSYLKKLDQ